MKKEYIFYSLIVGLLLLGLFFPKSNLVKNNILGGLAFTSSNQASSTEKVVGTTSTLIGTAFGSEQWLCNGGPVVAWIGFAGAAATTTDAGNGVFVPVSSTAACVGPFHFKGNVYGATRSGTAPIGLLDFK